MDSNQRLARKHARYDTVSRTDALVDALDQAEELVKARAETVADTKANPEKYRER